MSNLVRIKGAGEFFKCSRSKINDQIKKGAPVLQPGGPGTSVFIDTEEWMLWMKKEQKQNKQVGEEAK